MNKNIAGSADQALELLSQGNDRFLKRLDSASENGGAGVKSLKLISGAQTPICGILCCSDSRVPPEFIFDQGIGDLFIVRTAGYSASTSAIASMEFATLNFKIPLILVMGHSGCGAIKATLAKELEGVELPSTSLETLAHRLGSSVREAIKNNDPEENSGALADYAGRLHVQHTIDRLLESPILKEVHQNNEVGITGAFYSLDSGKVDFI